MDEEKSEKTFNFNEANLSDQITVVGELEHIYLHACKSASVSTKEDAVHYMTVAELAKDFRRKFMKRHFPDVDEKDWCLIKTTDAMRQRVYESASTSYEDLKAANDLWSVVMEHIFEIDLSGCAACRSDQGKESPAPKYEAGEMLLVQAPENLRESEDS